MNQPSNTVETVACVTGSAAQEGHEGSASTQLSGRAVLCTWLASITLHTLVFVVLFVVPWLAMLAREPAPATVRVQLVGDPDAVATAATPTPDPTKDATRTDRTVVEVNPRRSTAIAELSAVKRPELSIIGIGAGGSDFSDLGLTVGSGPGPEFFGLGGNARGARHIVYVVDRSGSMIDTFDLVRVELKRSVSALRRSQKFHVVFFAKNAMENPPKRLVSAIKEQKEQLFEFVDQVVPQGGTDPTAAMNIAFRVGADLIYFLTDGEFDPALLGRLDKWNERRQVRIFTIAYFNPEGAALLERIAREHGGEFKFVTDEDLP